VAPERRRGRRRARLLAAIAVLYVLSIPWYRQAGAAPAIVFGLPDWVATAVGCYLGVAVLNLLAWRLTDVGEDDA
jgi:hypothetical protein